MTEELRNSNRYNRFLPISVQALDCCNNEIIAGPYPGRIINISRYGACLLLSQMVINSFHMFHSIKESDTMCLQLTINIQPEIINCRLPGQPVWMSSFREGDIHAFKMGVRFTNDPETDEMKHLEEVVLKR